MAERKAAVPPVDPAQPIRFGSVAGIVVQREFGVPEFMRPMPTIGLLLPEPEGRFLCHRLNRFEGEALAALLDVAADQCDHVVHKPLSGGEVGEAGGVSVRWNVGAPNATILPGYRILLANRDGPRLDPTQAKALAALLRVAR